MKDKGVKGLFHSKVLSASLLLLLFSITEFLVLQLLFDSVGVDSNVLTFLLSIVATVSLGEFFRVICGGTAAYRISSAVLCLFSTAGSCCIAVFCGMSVNPIEGKDFKKLIIGTLGYFVVVYAVSFVWSMLEVRIKREKMI